MSKTTTADYVLLAVFVAAGFATIRGGEYARQQWLSSSFMQPVAQASVGPSAATTTNGGVIHLIQERPQAPLPTSSFQETPVAPEALNRVFQGPATGAAVSSVSDGSTAAVDYWERLQGRATELLRLGAIAHNGAVINGKFRALREVLVELEYPGGPDGKNVAPRLTAVSNNTATIREPVAPHRRIVLKLEPSR